ncbi:MAG: hypothetical protein ABSH39_06240 [Candidatus Acidiferrum sp.]|jgi:hypothetical protein
MSSNLEWYFSKMGARVKVLDGTLPQRNRRWGTLDEAPKVSFNIGQDKEGEYFEIRTDSGVKHDLVVLHAEPKERHLLLLSRQIGRRGKAISKQKFLCGHDERHWFVAAIPERAPVSTVADAKMALKPLEVREREGVLGVSWRDSFRRKNAAFVRQGEWFFVPVVGLKADPMLIHKNERLSRGNGGKAHWADECYRLGGESVFVSTKYPFGISSEEFRALPEKERSMGGFRMMRRDAAAYVRGEVRHPDHATVVLRDWHRVLMNTENQSLAMRFLTFLD